MLDELGGQALHEGIVLLGGAKGRFFPAVPVAIESPLDVVGIQVHCAGCPLVSQGKVPRAGFLDRFDAFTFAAPVWWLALELTARLPARP